MFYITISSELLNFSRTAIFWVVQKASTAEHQLHQDMRSNRGIWFNTKGTLSGSKFTQGANTNRGAIINSSDGLCSSVNLASSSKELALKVRRENLQYIIIYTWRVCLCYKRVWNCYWVGSYWRRLEFLISLLGVS